jgi:hypothetical protein
MSKLDRKRLVKVLGMLGSRHDGEALNAARTAHAMLSQANMSWNDLLGVKPGEEPDPVAQEEGATVARGRDKFADPEYADMVATLLKRKLDAKSRKRLEGMDEQVKRGLALGLDDKLLVRWLYHTMSGKKG